VADTTDDNLRRRPTQDRSAQRLTLILDTTASLIDEVGQSGLTPALIARNAGMSGPAIYRYFADIDSIVGALAGRNLELFLEATAELLSDPELTWEGAIEASVDTFSHMYETVPSFRTLGLGGGSGARFREGMSNKAVIAAAAIEYFQPRFDTWDRPLMQEHIEAMIEIIEALVRRAHEPDANTEFFLGEAKRIGVQYLGDFLLTVPGTPPADG
jgi:AcrR family transcriptional regulator